jgi:hypothetical protein
MPKPTATTGAADNPGAAPAAAKPTAGERAGSEPAPGGASATTDQLRTLDDALREQLTQDIVLPPEATDDQDQPADEEEQPPRGADEDPDEDEDEDEAEEEPSTDTEDPEAETEEPPQGEEQEPTGDHDENVEDDATAAWPKEARKALRRANKRIAKLTARLKGAGVSGGSVVSSHRRKLGCLEP